MTIQPDRVVKTGVARIDAALPGGGLPCGYVTELAGPPSCGKLGLAVRALAGGLAVGERAALVDVTRSFFSLSPELVQALARLLVCRVANLADGIAAAELLAAGGMALVVVDLGRVQGAIPAGARTALARLERAARDGQAAVVVVTEPPPGAEGLLGSLAALRLKVAGDARRSLEPAQAGSSVRVSRSRFGWN
jgi:RecA/RadA recombinase